MANGKNYEPNIITGGGGGGAMPTSEALVLVLQIMFWDFHRMLHIRDFHKKIWKMS